MQKPILILGACGQIGTELTVELRKKYGSECVIASDIREGNNDLVKSGPFELLDAT
ncbi:MAG: NAD-dependent epimerase, partial [Muricauda sp.]|nr:NAD-dependent epimerase [Allomuricauda sp.]